MSGTQGVADLASSLLAQARRLGADQAEVSVDEGTRFVAGVREGTVETLTQAGTRRLRLRVFVEGRTASATSSDLARDTLARLVENAVARARLAGKDPFAGLPEPGAAPVPAGGLGIFDPAILELPPEKKIAYARDAERVGLAEKGVVKSLGTRYITVDTNRTLLNSRGFSGSYRGTRAFVVAGFQAGSGDNLFQDAWIEGGTQLSKLPPPEELAHTAARRVTRLVGARKVPTQKVPVVVEPSVTASLLLGLLSECLDGQSVARRQSFLADKLGQKVGSDLVTVVDDGLLPGGLGTAPFDAEGVPCRRTTLLEKGVLKSLVLDTYYGRKLGSASTGNAEGTTNLSWAAGPSSPEAILASVGNGLLLTGTLGLGTDASTGDISMGAFGLWIEKGRPAFPVAEITISANLADILKGVEMVGDDLRLTDTTNGPTVKIAEMTIGGTAG